MIAALNAVLPVVDAAIGHGARARVITASQLTPDLVKRSNIVYVGYLSGLGLLRDPVFDAASFSIGASYDELVDDKTGRHYTSDWGDVASGTMPRRDYGYLANFTVPGGGRLLVIAGTRDAALAQDADVIALSSMAGAHLDFCRRLEPLLDAAGLADRLWIIGGNIPAADHDALRALGYRESDIAEIEALLKALKS